MIVSYKEFLTEKVSDNFLYHNTGLVALKDILYYNALGRNRKLKDDNRTWEFLIDVHGKHIRDKPFPGWISLTRSSHYASAPGNHKEREVRLVFDWQKIKNNYKTQAYADPFVTQSNSFDDLIDQGNKRRWESEERVFGPIKLDKTLVEIQLTKAAYEELVKSQNAFKYYIEKAKKNIQLIPGGTVILDKNNKFYTDDNPVAIRDTWRRLYTIQGMQGTVNVYSRLLADTEKILKHPLLSVGKI